MSDLRNFFLQLETTLGSGIPVIRALNLIGGNMPWGLRGKIEGMAKSIEHGSTFSEAMARAGRPFGTMQITFIKFGEETGCLDKVCGSLAVHAEKEKNLQQNIIQSMLYPGFVLMVALVMGPVIEAIMKSGGDWSAGVVPALINLVSFFLGAFGVWLVLTQLTAGLFDAILVHVPIVGMIVRNFALSRFARALSVGLTAGVPMMQTMSTAISVSGNAWLQNQLKDLPKVVSKGKGIAGGLSSCAAIPGTLKEMIAVGEESGRLPEMLEKTAVYFEEEASNRLIILMKLLPPILLVAVAIYVGSIIVTHFPNPGSLLSR